MYENILGSAVIPEKRVRKVPKHFDGNYKDTNLLEEIKHQQIYFEILDNMIGELNERMKVFTKVLDLFTFLNPDEFKKLSLEDAKKK